MPNLTEPGMGNSEIGEHLKDLTLAVNEDDPDSDAFLVPLFCRSSILRWNQNQLFLAVPVSGRGANCYFLTFFVMLITA